VARGIIPIEIAENYEPFRRPGTATEEVSNNHPVGRFRALILVILFLTLFILIRVKSHFSH
jgi:hypothetical protein